MNQPRDVTAEIVPSAKPMGVAGLIARIKGALASAFPAAVTVVGEISNLKMHSSGHVYFRLKDATCAIDAAMFRSAAARLKFRPSDGLEVVVEGRVEMYDVRGQLQLYVERMTPRGAGALELAFRQMREKLQAEGLFDPARKVAIPRFPRAIGVITSPTGAAIRDIGRTLRRRWPALPVFLVPVLVQGDGAAQDIAKAIGLLDACAQRCEIDTIIVGRGGGSIEDLWAFNEEAVARAIFACRTPIISGVGHEVDTTIADLVADLRAPTPTGAAELAVPDSAEIRRQLQSLAGRLTRCLTHQLLQAKASLSACLRSAVFRDPRYRIHRDAQRVDELAHRLSAGIRQRLAQQRRRLERPTASLASRHPARLYEQKKAMVEGLLSRLRWVLGGRAKQSGDQLTTLSSRLLAVHPQHRLTLASQQVTAIARQLEAMSYRNVLQRGYSVTRNADGKIIRLAAEVTPGAIIETELVDGKIASRATGNLAATDNQTAVTLPPPPPRRKLAPADAGPTLF